MGRGERKEERRRWMAQRKGAGTGRGGPGKPYQKVIRKIVAALGDDLLDDDDDYEDASEEESENEEMAASETSDQGE